MEIRPLIARHSSMPGLLEGTSHEASLEPGCRDLDVSPTLGRHFTGAVAEIVLRGPCASLSRLVGLSIELAHSRRAG